VWRGWRDPFADVDSLGRATVAPVRPFGSLWPFVVGRGDLRFARPVDVVRDGEDAVVRVELPGLDPERDLTVEVDGGYLVIRGERRDERSEEKGGRSWHAVRYGSFRRAFALPKDVSDEQISASYDAGILTVRVSGAFAGRSATRIPVVEGSAKAVETAEGESGDKVA
jgi:HSP20 family molecular chaperone IbpA